MAIDDSRRTKKPPSTITLIDKKISNGVNKYQNKEYKTYLL